MIDCLVVRQMGSMLIIATSFCHTLAAQEDGFAYFEARIRPVLIEHCYECHSANGGEVKGGLWLDSREGVANGGDSGPIVEWNDAGMSLLLNALRHQDLKMPPKSKLADSIIGDFEKWIAMGVPDPREASTPKPKSEPIDWTQAKKFWSFRPRESIQVPTIPSGWSQSPIDAFVEARRSASGLRPNAEATRSTWLRRVSIDLTGIPPTLDEVDAFIRNRDFDSHEQVVDRLLASPLYGERWGRYWLDLARYADSNGADENHGYPVAWRYRDYVTNSLNADTPYNDYIVEQLAGDLLPASSESEQGRLITATGFLVMGPKMLAEQDKPKLVADMVDEQVDTIGKVFLGLTLGCARCHDHKFDPILANDYYALASILHSTKSMEHLNFVSQWNERDLPDQTLSKSVAIYQERIDQSQSELAKKRRLYEDRDFKSQLSSLHLAMRIALQLEPVSNEALHAKATSKWNAILDKNADAPAKIQDFVRVWRELAWLDDLVFVEAAQSLWRDLAGDAKQSLWNQRLSKRPAPKTKPELMELYLAQSRDIWNEVRDAPRNEKGKITSAEIAKISKQVFEGVCFDQPAKIEETLEDDEKRLYLELKASVEKLEKEKPTLPRAMSVQDGPVRLVAVNVRGNHLQTIGEPLPAAVPTIFRNDLSSTGLSVPENGSGRLELAKWIADESNPLPARVMANRIWQGHFGEGLVATSSNFGLRGQLPSHPELLDWLANEFVRKDWSIKWLHRQIVLSATYRMGSQIDSVAEAIDPDNRLFWRQNRRRMEVEVLRDSLLSIGDVCDLRQGGSPQNATSVFHPNVAGASNIGSMRRTLYLDINRAAMSDFLMTFDYVEPGVSVERRPATIVPHQSLFLMNHPLPLEIGKQLAERLHSNFSNDLSRLSVATRTIFGREPKDYEIDLLHPFLNAQSSLVSMNSSLDDWVRVCRALLLTNEFLYVE